MTTSFNFDEKTLKILANFATINPSMIIQPDKLSVLNNPTSPSCIGFYNFSTPYDFEEFGIYETTELLSLLCGFNNIPTIEVKDKFLLISGDDSKSKYFTTAKTLVPSVPNIREKFDKVKCSLEFTLPADKLAAINKFSSILKTKYIFFETASKKIRITIGNELEGSNNIHEIYIEHDIKLNELTEPVKIGIEDFKILAGEYEVKIAPRISQWKNLNGVEYYLAPQVV